MDTKEKFRDLFNQCCEEIIHFYPTKSGIEREIVGEVVIRLLKRLTNDIERLDFISFYQKYLQGSLFLDCNDFKNSEIEEIIEESPLSDRDKKLARLNWIEVKTEEAIANELLVDKKTIRSNIPKISMVLKQTCSKMYKGG